MREFLDHEVNYYPIKTDYFLHLVLQQCNLLDGGYLSKNSFGNGHKLQDFSAHCQSEVSSNEA